MSLNFLYLLVCFFFCTRTQQMTGQNTSALLGRSTTTTVELRSPSGRSQKTCWRGKAHWHTLSEPQTNPDSHWVVHYIILFSAQSRTASCMFLLLFYKVCLPFVFTSGNNDRKMQSRWQRTVSPGTWITDRRPCRTKPQQVSMIKDMKKKYFIVFCVSFCVSLLSTETTSGDQSTAPNCGHSSSSSQSLNPSAAGALGSTPSSMSSSSSSSTGQVPPSVQSPSPALLQDPALLHQLLPALQATLQMNNGSMDMAKLNEGEDGLFWWWRESGALCVVCSLGVLKTYIL